MRCEWCARFHRFGKGFIEMSERNGIKSISFGWCVVALHTDPIFIHRRTRAREWRVFAMRHWMNIETFSCVSGRAWQKRNEDLYWMSCAGIVKIAIDIAFGLKICLSIPHSFLLLLLLFVYACAPPPLSHSLSTSFSSQSACSNSWSSLSRRFLLLLCVV